jgi:hypothetical protein
MFIRKPSLIIDTLINSSFGLLLCSVIEYDMFRMWWASKICQQHATSH